MENEISIQEQIHILKSVVDNIKNKHRSFVCVNVWYTLREKGYGTGLSWCDSIHASKYIPLLTIENAKIACKKAHVTMPKIQANNAWWSSTNWKSRVVFINWMIKELESKL